MLRVGEIAIQPMKTIPHRSILRTVNAHKASVERDASRQGQPQGGTFATAKSLRSFVLCEHIP